MSKIAAVDNQAMNRLFKGELTRIGYKQAGSEATEADAFGDPQAFKDHEEYLDTVDAVLKSDTKESFAPNNVLLD